MSKYYTPGPWKVYIGEKSLIRVEWGDFGIAQIYRTQDGPATEDVRAIANAYLVAAAPELLEALRPFAYLAQVMEDGQMLNFRGVYVSYEDAQNAAAAIAKAEATE